jgi:pimeloyl-ACP methyl ester carboxylesterase
MDRAVAFCIATSNYAFTRIAAMMTITFRNLCIAVLILIASALSTAAVQPAVQSPAAPGELVDLGGHKVHVHCIGKGTPTVVIENGFGDFSFDWILVQTKVAAFTRICTYDRAGYAWSDRGPQPRTLAQINLELHDTLAKLGERGPFVLVGHSFGGPVARNYVSTYPREVAGMVLVDAAYEGQRVQIGAKETMRLGYEAKGRSIPAPHEEMMESDKAHAAPAPQEKESQERDEMYKVLPQAEQKLQLWAQALPEMQAAENSQREWSPEFFAKWLAAPQAGTLGDIPLVVLTRAEGGYDESLDTPAAQMESERKEGQAKLAQLSRNSRQIIVHSGHNMDLEAPGEVTVAIRLVVEAVRQHAKL